MNDEYREQRITDAMGRCRHFNGLMNDTCKAGINYRALAGEPELGYVKRLPCLAKYRGDDFANCASLITPTREEAEAEDNRMLDRLNRFNDQMANGICPHCERPMTKRQVGRCVYAQPCGHRLYQGTIS